MRATSQLVVITAIISFLFETVNARHVSVDVKAPWSRYAATFPAEVSEFLAEESDDMFWKYVDAMCVKSEEIDVYYGETESSNSLQTLAFEVAESILPRSLHSLMNTVIGLNTYAPAVEFFKSMASPYSEPCGDRSFVVSFPGGRVSCDVHEALENTQVARRQGSTYMDLSYYSSDSYEWDHVYSSSSGANDMSGGEESAISNTDGGHLVLYGAIGSSSFCSLHTEIKSAIKRSGGGGGGGLLKYSARHTFPGQTPLSTSTRLQGYGVFLDIKNMEYKNVDDKKEGDTEGDTGTGTKSSPDTSSSVGKDGDEDLLEIAEGEIIAGVNLATLSKARPELDKQQLSSLKSDLLQAQELAITRDEGQNQGNMKIWKMKDLGLQTTVSVIKNKVSKASCVVHALPYSFSCHHHLIGSCLLSCLAYIPFSSLG